MQPSSLSVAAPILLLDFDGVINCFSAFGSDHVQFEPQHSPLPERTLRVPLGTGCRLVTLSQHFRITWATTREAHVHDMLSGTIELPARWPHLTWPQERSGATWKLAHVADWIDDRACAWIDDDLGHDAFAWAHERDQQVPTVLVQPSPTVGLTDEHVQLLIAWAERGMSRPETDGDRSLPNPGRLSRLGGRAGGSPTGAASRQRPTIGFLPGHR